MNNKLKMVLMTGMLALPLGMSTTVASAQERVLTISMDAGNAGQDSFNPFTTNRTNNVYYLVYDRLVEMGADGNIYPHLLESWDVSEDGLTIVFTLRDGVMFHDGSELNSEVLKWFLENLATGKSKYMVAAFESIEIKDNLTVEISLSRPDPNILYNFTSSFTGVPSMVAIEEFGEEFGRSVVIGTGPFMFDSWKTGDEIVLLRNPDYTWGSELSDNQGPANIDKIVFREILEDSTRFLEFVTGGVDILEKAPTLFLDKLQEDESVNIVTMASNGNYHMVMNSTNELLSDVNIRRAIALSVNQDDILAAVFQGNGTPAYTYLIDRLPARQVAPEREIRFDLETAKTIMADLGWVVGDDGILVKDGERLSLTLWSKSDSSERKVSVVIQAQLAELGIDIVIEQFDPSSIRAEYKTGEQDLVVRSYGWDNADILEWFFNSTRMGYPNVAMWHDNESDYLMHNAMTRSKNAEERIENFREYHEYLLAQYLWAPIINSVNIHAVAERVHMPDPRFKILIGPSLLDVTLD
ncbi:MAG: ABC transporter substrate-binding protein [Rhodobacteraceae bacterium]|nr:ABC transporter substrate-binding protein [Paracoccaceae bacterium]